MEPAKGGIHTGISDDILPEIVAKMSGDPALRAFAEPINTLAKRIVEIERMEGMFAASSAILHIDEDPILAGVIEELRGTLPLVGGWQANQMQVALREMTKALSTIATLLIARQDPNMPVNNRGRSWFGR